MRWARRLRSIAKAVKTMPRVCREGLGQRRQILLRSLVGSVLGSGALLSLISATSVCRPFQNSFHRIDVLAREVADKSSTARGLTTVTIPEEAIQAMATAFAYVVWDGGLLTDELRYPPSGLRASDLPSTWDPPGYWPFADDDLSRRVNSKDVRILPERAPGDTTPDDVGSQPTEQRESREQMLDEGYLRLQGARVYLGTAIDSLRRDSRDPAGTRPSQGELYALAGYADVLLADLFCSGVPLNTFANVPFVSIKDNEQGRKRKDWIWPVFGVFNPAYKQAIAEHHVVYHPSLTTAQVYRAAIAQFDTALRLASDSARVLNLARVGKGRAWLALGQYDSAAASVAAVPQAFVYTLQTWRNMDPDGDEEVATAADREGRTGLPYLSSRDPRTATQLMPSDKFIDTVRVPAKWTTLNANGQGEIPFTLASGVEGTLIRAEAALHHKAADRTWLQLLNSLRATAPIPGTSRPDPATLVPLRDPGTERERIALLFAERAYWLFLTGQRQGDLRRLVRVYGWPQEQVYPTGPYLLPEGFFAQVGHYGTDLNMPIPPEERANPYFHGCLDRRA